MYLLMLEPLVVGTISVKPVNENLQLISTTTDMCTELITGCVHMQGIKQIILQIVIVQCKICLFF